MKAMDEANGLNEIDGGRTAIEREWFRTVMLGAERAHIERLERRLRPAANDAVGLEVMEVERDETAVPSSGGEPG